MLNSKTQTGKQKHRETKGLVPGCTKEGLRADPVPPCYSALLVPGVQLQEPRPRSGLGAWICSQLQGAHRGAKAPRCPAAAGAVPTSGSWELLPAPGSGLGQHQQPSPGHSPEHRCASPPCVLVRPGASWRVLAHPRAPPRRFPVRAPPPRGCGRGGGVQVGPAAPMAPPAFQSDLITFLLPPLLGCP